MILGLVMNRITESGEVNTYSYKVLDYNLAMGGLPEPTRRKFAMTNKQISYKHERSSRKVYISRMPGMQPISPVGFLKRRQPGASEAEVHDTSECECVLPCQLLAGC